MRQKVPSKDNKAELRRHSTSLPGARNADKKTISSEFIPFFNERNHMGKLVHEVSPIRQSLNNSRPKKRFKMIKSTAQSINYLDRCNYAWLKGEQNAREKINTNKYIVLWT